ncbi:Hypothetical predicted protein, partial [Paramuricea clavata]
DLELTKRNYARAEDMCHQGSGDWEKIVLRGPAKKGSEMLEMKNLVIWHKTGKCELKKKNSKVADLKLENKVKCLPITHDVIGGEMDTITVGCKAVFNQ